MIAAFIGFGVTTDETNVAEKEDQNVQEDAKKADAKAKETADKLAADKEYYLKNIKTALQYH